MKQVYNASTSWKKASIKKPIHPLRFFSKLKWLDGSLLKILPYRQKIFSDLLYKFDDDDSLHYSLALLLRGKKNDKSLDGMLAQLYALCAWKPVGDFTGQIVAFDEGQADEDLDLFKKLVRANPVLLDLLTIKQKSVERKDGKGFVEIIPGRDIQGQHGGKFDLLVIDEIHTQRDWNLLESLQPDPTRQSLTWITSYNSIYHKPGVPLFDMLKQAWAGTDARMYSAITRQIRPPIRISSIRLPRRGPTQAWRAGQTRIISTSSGGGYHRTSSDGCISICPVCPKGPHSRQRK
jgi:hypothetical protein